jgi:hypothetical protein
MKYRLRNGEAVGGKAVSDNLIRKEFRREVVDSAIIKADVSGGTMTDACPRSWRVLSELKKAGPYRQAAES